jgi:hypothetical protein
MHTMTVTMYAKKAQYVKSGTEFGGRTFKILAYLSARVKPRVQYSRHLYAVKKRHKKTVRYKAYCLPSAKKAELRRRSAQKMLESLSLPQLQYPLPLHPVHHSTFSDVWNSTVRFRKSNWKTFQILLAGDFALRKAEHALVSGVPPKSWPETTGFAVQRRHRPRRRPTGPAGAGSGDRPKWLYSGI